MHRKRLAFVALGLAILLGLFIWQLPALLKALPSRYVAAYLPEALQELAERDHVEILPTVDATVDATQLLAQSPSLIAAFQQETSTQLRQPADSAGGSAAPPTPTPEPTSVAQVDAPPTPTTAPTLTPFPIAAAARLGPVTHHFQTWNNCGPATLAMALSYFNLHQNQEQTAAVLKPDPEDRNVSPHEMAYYVNSQTDLRAISRANGDLDQLRRMLAAGFPVIVELGLDPPGEYRWMGWYGHYLLLVAYDDQLQEFSAYDSWFGTSEVPGENADPEGRQISYGDLDAYWRQFSRNYIVLFEPAQEDQVATIIGNALDDTAMWQAALVRAQEEVAREPDNAFLWFSLGTAFNALADYEKAATAFDQARAIGLPWRMLWYQFGPYEAYYQVGRYEDVKLLTEVTLMDRPYFEESYYYRGLANAALGDLEAARDDLEKAVRRNVNFGPAVEALAQLGS